MRRGKDADYASQRLRLALFSVLGIAIAGIYVQPAWAQPEPQVSPGPAVATQPPRTGTYPLSGAVVDSVTGEPIRKALVQVYSTRQRVTFTDDNGHFTLEGLPAGSYSVAAHKPGYFNQQELLRGAGITLAEVGPNSKPAIVRLTPEAILSGRVTTTTGIPLEHASLSLNYIEIREGRRRWDFKGSAMTDEDGRYRFANLRPGSYYISVSPYTPLAETMLDAEQPPKSGYSGVYYPGAPDLATASPILLSAGEHGEANFSLAEVPVYAVSGTVSGYAANQGVGLQVLDQSGVQVDRGAQFSPENGRFDILALAPGNYVIKAFASGGPNQQLRAQVAFHLAGDLHNLHLALAPSPSIPVNVQMDGASQRTSRRPPIQRLVDSGPPLSVRLASNGPGRGEAYASFESPNNRQALSLRDVEPGRYTAVLEAREGWYVASAEYGQTNLLNDDLVLTAGAPRLPIEIVLRNDSGSILGTVNAPDDFSSQAIIVAVPERSAKASPAVTYWYPARDRNAPRPEFILDSLAPGEYLVYAFDHAEGLEYTSRDVLQNYSSRAAHVTVASDQRAKVALQLIRTGESGN